MVVLFVDDDEAEVEHGRKDGGPRAYADLGPGRSTQAAPLFGALRVVEGRVEDGHLIAKARA